MANNTFGFSGFGEENPGAFGSLFGGVQLSSCVPWLESASGGVIGLVPEPNALALAALGLLGARATR